MNVAALEKRIDDCFELTEINPELLQGGDNTNETLVI